MAKKQDQKKQRPPAFPSSSKVDEEQRPSSPRGPSLSTKPLAKSATTGAKQEKQLPPLLPNSPSTSTSESSSDEDDPLPPASSRSEKPGGASSATVLPKHEPSDSSDGKKEEDDEDSETDSDSMEDESPDDAVPAVAKPEPLTLLRASREGNSTVVTVEEEDDDSETEEDESSDDASPAVTKPNPLTLLQASRDGKGKHNTSSVSGSESVEGDGEDVDSSSESDQDKSSPPKFPLNTAAPLSSKPVDGPSQSMDKSGIIASSISDSKKKRKRDNNRETGLQKLPFQRIWSYEDEVRLLRGILEYKERYHVVPSTAAQLEPLHASIKGSLSVPVTLIQMHQKVRRMKVRYEKASRINDFNTPPTANAHAAAVFDLSKNIWGSRKDESPMSVKKIKGGKMKKDIRNVKVKEKQFPVEFPSFHRFIKHKHTHIPLELRFNHIPNNKSKELEAKCKEVEITEIRLHHKKQELLCAALKLIEGALSKNG